MILCTMSCLFFINIFFSPGSPPPVITWSKLRAPLPWKHTVDNGVLTLTEVGRQDSGQYICNATNEHGYSEVYTQMEVESESGRVDTVTPGLGALLAPDHIKNPLLSPSRRPSVRHLPA